MGLVPSPPLSEDLFDDLGRIVASVVGCAQHRCLVRVLVDSHRNLDDWYSRTDSLHHVLLPAQPRPTRQAILLRPSSDFSVLFRHACIVAIGHSHMCTQGWRPYLCGILSAHSSFVTRGRATASSILVRLGLALDVTHPLTHRGAESSRP